ncbi:MAG: PAS domain S-box protein, partial [Desulfobacterales bacterium]|nr:PAS domain S-box protein [Desulfobacterales bacterium]
DGIQATPDARLQYKNDRDYFKAVISLPGDRVFLSKIDYNKDFGRITRPEIRTLRVALPVYDGSRIFGMIVINVDIGPELDRLGQMPSQSFYLFNPAGQFLIHPDPAVGFGFESGSLRTMAKEPDTRSINPARAGDSRVWVDGTVVKAFRRIELAAPQMAQGHCLLYMLAVTPKDLVLNTVSRNQRHSIYLTLVLILLSAVLILFFSRYMTRPLYRMTRDAAMFRSGDNPRNNRVNIMPRQGDEIRVLGRAFSTMTRRIDRFIAELEARENRLQSIMNTAVEGLIITDRKGNINDVNPAAESLFGYDRDELIGANVSMLMPQPHERNHTDYMERYIETGRAAIIGKGRAETGRRKDGSLVPVFLSISEFRVGDALYFTGFIRDITDEVRANKALEQAKEDLEKRVEERTGQLSLLNSALRLKIGELRSTTERLRLFEQIFTQSDEAIVITDENERIIDVNDAYVRASGYGRRVLIGNTPRIGKSDTHDNSFYKGMWDTIRTQGSWKGEVWDRRSSGEVFPKLLSISAVSDGAGKITNYVGIFSDISKLKATEEKLKNLAYYDPLTGLPNRELFRVLLQKEIDQVKRNNTLMAVMYLDLDRFKYVTDTYGHSMGDRLLRRVANRLQGCLR